MTPEHEEVMGRYAKALTELLEAQQRLKVMLQAVHKHGIYPSPPEPLRYHLPDERSGSTHAFSLGMLESSIKGYLTANGYTDGVVGELFIEASKNEGSLVAGLLDSFALLFSTALQYGVPLEGLINKFKFTKFEPAGMTQNPKIRMAHSVIDYIMQWLELKEEAPT